MLNAKLVNSPGFESGSPGQNSTALTSMQGPVLQNNVVKILEVKSETTFFTKSDKKFFFPGNRQLKKNLMVRLSGTDCSILLASNARRGPNKLFFLSRKKIVLLQNLGPANFFRQTFFQEKKNLLFFFSLLIFLAHSPLFVKGLEGRLSPAHTILLKHVSLS